MGDIPAASDIGDDDPVVAQAFNDTASIVRQRLVGKVEVAGIVDAGQYVIFGQETRGDAGLPQEWLKQSGRGVVLLELDIGGLSGSRQ